MAQDLQLLLLASGQPDIKQFAAAHGLSENTVRTWDKRDGVPLGHMRRFEALYATELAAAKVNLTRSGLARGSEPNPSEQAAMYGHAKSSADVPVTLLQARELPPTWKVDAEAPSTNLMSLESPSSERQLSPGALLRSRGAGVVHPLVLSLPLAGKGAPTGEYELIPMHMRPAAAGVGALAPGGEPDLLNLAGQMAFSFEWLKRNLGHTSGQLTTIDVRGDSMAPTLLDGETIMIDEGVVTVDVDGIYVLDLYGRRLVKRVQHLYDGTLVLISDNSSYQRETIPKDQAREVVVIGRMVWPRVR